MQDDEKYSFAHVYCELHENEQESDKERWQQNALADAFDKSVNAKMQNDQQLIQWTIIPIFRKSKNKKEHLQHISERNL